MVESQTGAQGAAPGSAASGRRPRVGVIGAGYIAREHLECLNRLDDAEPIAICDLSPTVAEATAEMFDLPHWYTDHKRMLRDLDLDVVHIATPPSSHVPLARDVLEANCHAFVEKPIALTRDEFAPLRQLAEERKRLLIEDHNYLFNPSIQAILAKIASGEFGEVVHVEASFCVPLGEGKHADPDAPSPFANLPGGAMVDFLTHLSYLACAFIGPHERVDSHWSLRAPESGLRFDELRALVAAERGSAVLSISSHSQPDIFSVRVHGTKMRAAVSLFEPLLVFETLRPGPSPLVPVQNGLAAGWAYSRSAVGGLLRKLSGRPLTYEGLWVLFERMYGSLRAGGEPPIGLGQVQRANELVWDILEQEPRS